jgi:hypothetical protein
MTWKSSKGYYELVKTLAARPPCVTVNTDCGGAATSCF